MLLQSFDGYVNERWFLLSPIIQLYQRFLPATKDNVPLPPKMKNSFVNVLTDFLTIIKYRKKGINKILSERIEKLILMVAYTKYESSLHFRASNKQRAA